LIGTLSARRRFSDSVAYLRRYFKFAIRDAAHCDFNVVDSFPANATQFDFIGRRAKNAAIWIDEELFRYLYCLRLIAATVRLCLADGHDPVGQMSGAVIQTSLARQFRSSDSTCQRDVRNSLRTFLGGLRALLAPSP